jgi:PemK-like protein.
MASIRFTRGEVRWGHVPYKENPDEAKTRPVVVIGWSAQGPGDDAVVLCVPITGFGDGGRPRNGDVELLDYAKYGLTKRSWARARRVWGADPTAITGPPRGTISKREMDAILREIADLF